MADSPRIAITIARQVGAGGTVLGPRLARRLNFTYLDRALLRLVARRAGVTHEELAHWDEHVSRFWERISDAIAVGPAEGVYNIPVPTPVRDRDLFELESQIIRETAARRNLVVIGRGGFHVLRDHPRLVSVYLHAPLASRVAAVIKNQHLPDEPAALDFIRRTDVNRTRFIREMTGALANDAQAYHLCIDTGKLGYDLAEELIVRVVEQVRGSVTAPAAPAVPAIPADSSQTKSPL